MSSIPRFFAFWFAWVTALSGYSPAQEGGTSAEKKDDAPASPGGESAPGTEAVERVRKLGFRLSSKSSPGENAAPGATAASPQPADTATGAAGGTPSAAGEETTNAEGSLRIGRVMDPVALPPEVAELAREGALAVAAEQWETARDLYLEMVKIAPDNALAYANLGVAEHQLGNHLAAAGNLGKATTLNPHIARNWQTLGLIQYERGELALALSSLTRAIHEDPSEAESRLILAAVARDFGWPEAALTELQRAVEINPKLASAHYNLAVTYLGADPPKLELARRHYFAAIDLGTPPSPEIEAILKPTE